MKPSSLLSLSILSAGLALSLATARADNPSNPPFPSAPPSPGATPDGGQAPAGHHRRMHPAYVLAELTEKLALTPDQQKSIGGIISAAEAEGKALREDDTLSKEDKRQKMKANMDVTRSQIRAALTPDQQKTFDALPGRGEHGPKPAVPTPTPAT